MSRSRPAWTALDLYTPAVPSTTPREFRAPIPRIDEPGQPRPAPLAWSARVLPERRLALGCLRYEACQTVAAKACWQGWSCAGCEHVPDGAGLLEPPPSRRATAPPGATNAPAPTCQVCGKEISSLRAQCGAVTCPGKCFDKRRRAEWAAGVCLVCGVPIDPKAKRATCSSDCAAALRRDRCGGRGR